MARKKATKLADIPAGRLILGANSPPPRPRRRPPMRNRRVSGGGGGGGAAMPMPSYEPPPAPPTVPDATIGPVGRVDDPPKDGETPPEGAGPGEEEST